jgi:hypothetical protein
MIAMKNKVASYSSLGESNSIFLHTPDDMEGLNRPGFSGGRFV